jgi:hypothetical protein
VRGVHDSGTANTHTAINIRKKKKNIYIYMRIFVHNNLVTCDMKYLLTAIRLTTGGSSTVHT